MKCTPIAMVVLIAACGERGSGEYAFDSRQLQPFTAVENLGEVNLYLSVAADADAGELFVSGDANLLGAVRTWVRDQTLVVETDHDLWPSMELRLVAEVTELTDLEVAGSGDAHVTGLAGDFLIRINGSGDGFADGALGALEVRSNASGDAHLDGSAEWLEVTATARPSHDVSASCRFSRPQAAWATT